MSSSLFEIYWADGPTLVTRIPDYIASEDALGQAVGEAVCDLQPEMDVCYEADKGLWVEWRFHEPSRFGSQEELELRGSATNNKNSFFMWVVAAEELGRVAAVYYLGAPFLVRMAGELVPVNRLDVLSSIYLGNDGEASTVMQIARVAEIIQRDLSGEGIVGSEAEVEAAKRLGISREALAIAKDMAERIDAADAEALDDDGVDGWVGVVDD